MVRRFLKVTHYSGKVSLTTCRLHNALLFLADLRPSIFFFEFEFRDPANNLSVEFDVLK